MATAQRAESDAGDSRYTGPSAAITSLANNPNYKPPALNFGGSNFTLPYPNAPHDGGPEDLANTQAIVHQESKYNQYQAILNNQDNSWEGKLALAMSLAAITAGAGAFIGPAVSGAVGGGTAGSIAGGAATGAVTGAAGATLTGQNIGKGALLGGVVGGIGGGVTSGLSNAGAPSWLNTVGTGVAKDVSKSYIGNALYGSPSSSGYRTGTTASGGGGSNYIGATAGALGAGGLLYGGATGNNGNMASTDSSLASTFMNAAPGIIQGVSGMYGSQNAAQKMTDADNNAIKTQNDTLGNINSIWNPQRSLGQGADAALGSALGTNGKPADYSGFENMPGYQFAVNQGTQAIQRQAAAMGNAYTPNTAAAVGQYVTGTAMQDYNTYVGQLMGAAGLGSTANAGVANPTYNTGANISTLQQNQGYAQASGVSGASNAFGGMFGPGGAGSSLLGSAGKYLFGGSGGGSGGGSSGGYGYTGGNSGAPNMSNGGAFTGSGVDPNTFPGSTQFDPNSVTMPDISNSIPSDTSWNDFGGGLDYGSGATDFLGGL